MHTKFCEMEDSSQVAHFRHIAKLWWNWSSQLIAMEISDTEKKILKTKWDQNRKIIKNNNINV